MMRTLQLSSEAVINPSAPSVILLPPSLDLEWTASESVDVAGYYLYYGTASHSYEFALDVGNALSTTVTNLEVGGAYWFAVTAYDSMQDESDYSDELTCVVPQKLGLLLDPVGTSLQCSTNLMDWSPRAAKAATNMWIVTQSTNAQAEFFRSVSTAP